MNYKLEKFWNSLKNELDNNGDSMNYKLEKFWNPTAFSNLSSASIWTINLKSFEIDNSQRSLNLWENEL